MTIQKIIGILGIIFFIAMGVMFLNQNSSIELSSAEPLSELSVDLQVAERLKGGNFDVRAEWIDTESSAKRANYKINGYEMFARGPLGTVGNERIPFVFFRLLPEVYRKYTGESDLGTLDSPFEKFGFFKDPRYPEWPTPVGFTWGVPSETDQDKTAYVVRTCASCHNSRVSVGENYRYIDGAPNHEMNQHEFSATVVNFLVSSLNPQPIEGQAKFKSHREKTKKLILETLEAEINNRGIEFFFSNQKSYSPTGELVTFDAQKAQEQVDLFKSGIDQYLEVIYKFATIRKIIAGKLQGIYNGAQKSSSDGTQEITPNSFSSGPAGILDSNGLGIASIFAALEHKASGDDTFKGFLSKVGDPFQGSTKVSIPAVWEMGQRAAGQWDASVRPRFYRNAIAALGFVATPLHLDGKHIEVVSEFMKEILPPKYPFEVNQELASYGKELFSKYQCQSCHRESTKDFNDEQLRQDMVFNVGTSMNRAHSVTNPLLLNVVGKGLLELCNNPENGSLKITIDSNSPYEPCKNTDKIFIPRVSDADRGYPALPLKGAWATAPYLNNGSVPTLFHLLASKDNQPLRPEKFLAGSTEYDEENVGWYFDIALTEDAKRFQEAKKLSPALSIYDTSLDGFSNKGHFGSLTLEEDLEPWTDAKGVNHSMSKRGYWMDSNGQLFKLSFDVESESEELMAIIEYLKSI